MRYSTTEFETLYTQCFPSSMRLAMGMLHEEDEARDVVQEVFLKIWESETKVENPKAFIIRAVRNAALNRINMLDTREKIRQRISLNPPTDDYDFDERGEEVATAIQQVLTPREREVVESVYGEGLSYKETAKSLNVSVATVNKNVVTSLR